MSKLLQSTNRLILQQRIPWANLDNSPINRHQRSSIANNIFKRQLLFVSTNAINSNIVAFPPTSLSTPAQVVRRQNSGVYDTLSRRQYHCLFGLHLEQSDNSVTVYNNSYSSSYWNLCPTRFYSDTFHKYQSIMDVPGDVFRGSVDRFNGITVESLAEYEENVDFSTKLEKSLDFWTKNKRRGIWFKIQTEHAGWIPHLTKHQFDFHHAKNGFVVMCRWLPTDEYVNIPDYAHTMVGVGGLVVNNKNEVLVVSERYALIPNSWKLPGGYVEPRENLIDAAIREVREETGIECTFKTVVCIRHSHGGGFGCSDVYVVVGLTPLNEELQRCEREIAKIQWMPIDEYLQHKNVHETNRHFVRTLQDYDRRGIRFTCEMGKHQILKKEYCLYFMQAMPEQDEKSKI